MRAAYKPMLALMWLALVTAALNYWRTWEQLAARTAVQFDSKRHPSGYTSKQGAVELGLGIITVMLGLFTVAGLIAHAMRPAASWPLLFIFYVVIGICRYGNNSIVSFNLRSQQIHSEAFRKGQKQLPILSRKMLDQDPRRQLGTGNWEPLL